MTTTNQPKSDGLGGSNLESFDTNLLHIEETNRLLANIESRLNNFFHRNMNSHSSPIYSQEREQREQGYPKQARSPVQNREDFLSNVTDKVTSPTDRKRSIQNVSPRQYDLNLKSSDRYINIIDTSSHQEVGTKNGAYDSSIKFNKSKESLMQSTSPNRGQNKELSLRELNSTSPGRYSATRDDGSQIRENYRSPNKENGLGSLSRSGKQEDIGKENNVDARFYERKIRILEERLESSDKEINNLVKIKGNLNGEIVRMKAQLTESQNRFIEELNRSLKAQEERLRNEFYEQNKYKEEGPGAMNNIEKIERLTVEKNELKQELTELKRRYERLRQEKEQLEGRGNDRSLKFSQISSEGRRSPGKNQDDMLQSEHLKVLTEALSIYKQELETIKENNSVIRVQFEQEIEELREELDKQKERNAELEARLQDQDHVLGKYQSISLEHSQRKERSSNRGARESSRESPSKGKKTPQDRGTSRSNVSFREGELKSKRKLERSELSPSQIADGKSRLYEEQSVSMSPNVTYKMDYIPFTNNEIKTGLMGQERKGRPREDLYKQLVELQGTPKMHSASRSRSKTKSRSRSATKREEEGREKSEVERYQRRQKSPGTAYEEFEEELKRLKGIVSTKIVGGKKSEKKGEMVNEKNKGRKERKPSMDARSQKSGMEKKSILSSSSKILKASPNVSKVMKVPMSSKSKTSIRRSGV